MDTHPSESGLDDELRALVEAVMPPQHVATVVRRMGLQGHPRPSLEQIGRKLRCTREWVRQIVDRFVRAIDGTRPELPAFDRFLAEVATAAPLGAQALTDLARAAGASGPWSPDLLIDVARALGRATAFELHPNPKLSMIMRTGDRPLVDAIYAAARTASGFPGVTRTAWLALLASERVGPVPLEVVARVLPGIRGFEWLVDDFGWLRNETRNHLVTNVRKCLAVVPRLRLADLGEGVRRGLRFRPEWAPTDAAVEALCRRLDGVEIVGEEVRADPAPSWDVLNEAERVLMDVFVREGPVVRYSRLRDAILTTELHEGNLARLAGVWPMVFEVRRGVYALIGTIVDGSEAPPVDGIGYEILHTERPPPDVQALARRARGWCEGSVPRAGARDAYVVRVAGDTLERWGLDLAAPVDAVVRAIANQRRPIATGVALVRRTVRRRPQGPVEGIGVLAEQGGRTVETWAPEPGGAVVGGVPEEAGELWLRVDAGRTLAEILEASRALRRSRTA